MKGATSSEVIRERHRELAQMFLLESEGLRNAFGTGLLLRCYATYLLYLQPGKHGFLYDVMRALDCSGHRRACPSEPRGGVTGGVPWGQSLGLQLCGHALSQSSWPPSLSRKPMYLLVRKSQVGMLLAAWWMSIAVISLGTLKEHERRERGSLNRIQLATHL